MGHLLSMDDDASIDAEDITPGTYIEETEAQLLITIVVDGNALPPVLRWDANHEEYRPCLK